MQAEMSDEKATRSRPSSRATRPRPLPRRRCGTTPTATTSTSASRGAASRRASSSRSARPTSGPSPSTAARRARRHLRPRHVAHEGVGAAALDQLPGARPARDHRRGARRKEARLHRPRPGVGPRLEPASRCRRGEGMSKPPGGPRTQGHTGGPHIAGSKSQAPGLYFPTPASFLVCTRPDSNWRHPR